jgi:hypothetical protein
MGASIREISQSTTQAAGVAARAVDVTKATSEVMATLGDSSSEIGNVVKVITAIAEQTNLLALNATIEAADAGKGFAVVASEVKDLAQETARATDDISQRVTAIQTAPPGNSPTCRPTCARSSTASTSQTPNPRPTRKDRDDANPLHRRAGIASPAP